MKNNILLKLVLLTLTLGAFSNSFANSDPYFVLKEIDISHNEKLGKINFTLCNNGDTYYGDKGGKIAFFIEGGSAGLGGIINFNHYIYENNFNKGECKKYNINSEMLSLIAGDHYLSKDISYYWTMRIVGVAGLAGTIDYPNVKAVSYTDYNVATLLPDLYIESALLKNSDRNKVYSIRVCNKGGNVNDNEGRFQITWNNNKNSVEFYDKIELKTLSCKDYYFTHDANYGIYNAFVSINSINNTILDSDFGNNSLSLTIIKTDNCTINNQNNTYGLSNSVNNNTSNSVTTSNTGITEYSVGYYKNIFGTKLNSKLKSISTVKLNIILNKLSILKSGYTINSKKYNQLLAIVELINDKLNERDDQLIDF